MHESLHARVDLTFTHELDDECADGHCDEVTGIFRTRVGLIGFVASACWSDVFVDESKRPSGMAKLISCGAGATMRLAVIRGSLAM